MNTARYITTTLPYVNADPHIGFALELVQADILARHFALSGDSVFFNTGTDEHGQKIFQRATEEGKDPQAYTDEYAAKFRKLKETLDLSAELHFIRTTDPHHRVAAQEIWKRCAAKGDIYKKTYKGLYCVGDEMFLKEGDLVNGRCPNHPNLVPQEIEEENYFFRLSAYQGPLVAYLSRDGVIVPEWRRLEALTFVQAGLEDFSISREKSRLPWGVPVPGDEGQVMYVWFDALTNYISTLGWPAESGDFKTFWTEGETLQLAGKDQVRFQSVMWQAMLMSAGVKPTDRVLYHGFITSGGQKMSKSLGNVIDPLAIVKEYGADALRYFLARHVHPFEDSDFTMERFKEAYNADLVNGLGNLVSRVMQLSEKNDVATLIAAEQLPSHFSVALTRYDFNDACAFVQDAIRRVDQKINEEESFKVVKSDPALGKAMIQLYVQEVRRIGSMLAPIMPATSKKILDAVKQNKKPANLFPRKE